MTKSIWQQYQTLKIEQPKLRQREAAQALGISEAELLNANPDSIALSFKLGDILKAMQEIGIAKTVTRNEEAVHEKVGTYSNMTLSEKTILLLNPDGLDLRIFVEHWQFAFAIEVESPKGVSRSIQFFDAAGDAVHKAFFLDNPDLQAWQRLINQFQTEKSDTLSIQAKQVHAIPYNPELDADTFKQEWLALKDIHHFHGLLRRHKLGRMQAFENAPEDYAYSLPASCLEQILTIAAETQQPIMAFVGNPGIVQIHTGPVQTIRRVGEWINVLDPAFNLHLRDDLVDQVWLIKRPTVDGIITTIEAFNKQGESIISFFGKRIEGEAERQDWRDLTDRLLQKQVEPEYA